MAVSKNDKQQDWPAAPILTNNPLIANVRKWRALFWLLLMSAPAVLIGASVMRQTGIKATIWGQNIGVWLICSTLFIACGRSARLPSGSSRMRIGLLLSATVMVGLPFCFPGLDGVHRWLVFERIRLHPASFAIPIFLAVFRIAEREVGSRPIWALALLLGALLVAQPDAAEATGFTLASLALLIVRRGRSRIAVLPGAILGFLLLTCAWFRPDPLGAIPYVEGIVGLAMTLSPVLGFPAIASLALAVLPFFIISKYCRDADHCATVIALGLYFGGILLASLSGRFPIPLMGYGASGIIGYFIALACSFKLIQLSILGECAHILNAAPDSRTK
jgi:hypothetical protein